MWCPDASLGGSRLGGPEPRGIRRVTKLSDLPPLDSFPITDRILQQTLMDNKVTLAGEIERGCLFIVDHEVSFHFHFHFLFLVLFSSLLFLSFLYYFILFYFPSFPSFLDIVHVLEFMKEQVSAVPIALFWWDEEKKQLLPLVIQVFQKHHPTENPLVTCKDGLLWETAKIFFQVATAMVHSSCSHEYGMIIMK